MICNKDTLFFIEHSSKINLFDFFRYIPRHRRHDLESFVRTLMFYLLGLELPSYGALGKCQVQGRAQIMIDFWNKVDNGPITSLVWTKALEIARSNEKNDQQLNKLKQLLIDDFFRGFFD